MAYRSLWRRSASAGASRQKIEPTDQQSAPSGQRPYSPHTLSTGHHFAVRPARRPCSPASSHPHVMPRAKNGPAATDSPAIVVAKRSRPRRIRSPELDDIPASDAAVILGRGYPTQFNLERERRQFVFDPIEGLSRYPAEYLRADMDHAAKAAKAAFDKSHHLVVIEWGGSKPLCRAWTYSRRQCTAVAARGLHAELEARIKWGLPTLSKDLCGGARAPRRARVATQPAQENGIRGGATRPASGEQSANEATAITNREATR